MDATPGVKEEAGLVYVRILGIEYLELIDSNEIQRTEYKISQKVILMNIFLIFNCLIQTTQTKFTAKTRNMFENKDIDMTASNKSTVFGILT